MENLKVKVGNEAESKEAQELFFELGGDFYLGGKLHCNTHLSLVTINKEGLMANIELDGFDYKEITLPQLRDMVVLKRNDPRDATHVGKSGSQYYIGDKSYFWDGGKWDQRDFAYIANLKPIEKPMKEYLVRLSDGSYLYTNNASCYKSDDVVEIQSGVNCVAEKDGKLYFAFTDELPDGYVVVWQRSETEYLMQGKSGEVLVESVGKLNGVDAKKRDNDHYYIDVSDLDEIDFYEIAKRYNVTDPAIQHILKKCLAVGNRGHKDMQTDLKDIFKTAKRAIEINGVEF